MKAMCENRDDMRTQVADDIERRLTIMQSWARALLDEQSETARGKGRIFVHEIDRLRELFRRLTADKRA
jgi:hypothetical protein